MLGENLKSSRIIINKEEYKVHVKSWCPQIEESAQKQVDNLAKLPFAFHHIAIMPDCHAGYGMPIGGVLATEKVVVPNAVGVDIGCGMCAVKTPWTVGEIQKELIKKIMGKIREVIPVGFEKHKVEQDEKLMPYKLYALDSNNSYLPICCGEYRPALHQLGTLGGGNHFIEIQKDTEGFIWIMIHSGSRNLGYKVANYYVDLAEELNGKWFAYVPKEWELGFLPLDSDEGRSYLLEMQYCVDFALANRKLMMERIADIFNKTISWKKIEMENMINIAHNYAKMENHFGKNVMVHRKGATYVPEGATGIIPGSQGSKSYIVKGLGNPDSFMSCSHGAGRRIGRKEAQRSLNLEEEIKKLDDQGIIHGIRTVKDLDEAAGAYKNIDEVMANQKDLVEIVTELSPIAVIKGD